MPLLVSGAGLNENSPSDEQRRRWHQQQDKERDEAAADVEQEEARRLHANPPRPPFIPDSEPDSKQPGLEGKPDLTKEKEEKEEKEAPPQEARSFVGSLLSLVW